MISRKQYPNKTLFFPIDRENNDIGTKWQWQWQWESYEGGTSNITQKYTTSTGVFKKHLYGEASDTERVFKGTITESIAEEFLAHFDILEIRLLLSRSTCCDDTGCRQCSLAHHIVNRRTTSTYRTECSKACRSATCSETCGGCSLHTRATKVNATKLPAECFTPTIFLWGAISQWAKTHAAWIVRTEDIKCGQAS
jgi:hypothetical protein